MKQRLVIISDLWGTENPEWLESYLNQLKANFDIKYYDSCKLGGINIKDYSEENLHKQFVNGGIDTAVNQLLENEKEAINILAFSIGGTIAWKAGLMGLKIKNMYAVSATRLRKETKQPTGNMYLFYGGKDNFRPENKWFKELKLEEYLSKEKGHEMYLEEEFKNTICNKINNLG